MEDIVMEIADRVLSLEHDLSTVVDTNKRLVAEIHRLNTVIDKTNAAVTQSRSKETLSGRRSVPPRRVSDPAKHAPVPTKSTPVRLVRQNSKVNYAESDDAFDEHDSKSDNSSEGSIFPVPEPVSSGDANRNGKEPAPKKKSKGDKQKAKPTSSNAHMKKYHLYSCSVQNCDCDFFFPGSARPPLDENGFVTDQKPWPRQKLRYLADKVRKHMRKDHPNVPEDKWPPGFAMIRRKPKPAAVATAGNAAMEEGNTGKSNETITTSASVEATKRTTKMLPKYANTGKQTQKATKSTGNKTIKEAEREPPPPAPVRKDSTDDEGDGAEDWDSDYILEF